ncbi:MAG: Maf family protein [Fuerstiella sp.]|nr:Maf family protein [Fuerstiella sp.]
MVQFVLGSRSPRRRQLFESVVSADHLVVCPPQDSNEQGFDDLSDPQAIQQRLLAVVRRKMTQVIQQLNPNYELPVQGNCVITADTIVVVNDPGFGTLVLGQPCPENWQSEVRDWMLRLYSKSTHEVWTGFRVTFGNRSHEEIVRTTVSFCELTPSVVDHYIATQESIGKAGGYAVQGQAAIFVEAIDGSLSNIIGLPMMEVVRAIESLGVPVPNFCWKSGDSHS